MFVGCSEISISVFVKHVQHIEIIRNYKRNIGITYWNYKFFSAWGTEKIAGLWFVRVDQYPG